MLKTLLKSSLVLVAMAAAPQMAHADIIEYDVTDSRSTTTRNASCTHGLFIQSFGSACNQRFSLQDGALFSLDTNSQTATFSGSAINQRGQVANINLSFSDFLDTTVGTGFRFNTEGGGSFDPFRDAPAIDFFSQGSGSITVDNQRFALNPRDPFRGNTIFQFGTGADNTPGAFEGGAWLNLIDRFGRSIGNADINLAFARRAGVAVSAPAGLGLMVMGLMGLGLGLRRRRSAIAS
jgi:hypothetical protein